MELLEKSDVASVLGHSFALYQKRLDATTDFIDVDVGLELDAMLVPCWCHAVCWPFTGNSGLLNLTSYFVDDPCILDSVLPVWQS